MSGQRQGRRVTPATGAGLMALGYEMMVNALVGPAGAWHHRAESGSRLSTVGRPNTAPTLRPRDPDTSQGPESLPSSPLPLCHPFSGNDYPSIRKMMLCPCAAQTGTVSHGPDRTVTSASLPRSAPLSPSGTVRLTDRPRCGTPNAAGSDWMRYAADPSVHNDSDPHSGCVWGPLGRRSQQRNQSNGPRDRASSTTAPLRSLSD